jgi:hypothetical protein
LAEPLLRLTDFSLVYGPINLPDPAVSFDVEWEFLIHTSDEVAAAILSVPGVRLVHPAEPDWNAWKARWESGGHWIEFDIADCPFDPEYERRPGLSTAWGGSWFNTCCTLSELLAVWEQIRQQCPGICLHDCGDCRMYCPESFARAWAERGLADGSGLRYES